MLQKKNLYVRYNSWVQGPIWEYNSFFFEGLYFTKKNFIIC